MNRRMIPPRPERRFRNIAPFAAAVLTLSIAAAIAALLFFDTKPTQGRAVGSVRGETLDLAVDLETDLPDFGGTALLMRSRKPLPVTLRVTTSARDRMDMRIRWQCTNGAMEESEGVLRNRFLPPPGAAVGTIQATVSLHVKGSDRASKIPVMERTAVLKVLVPISADYLRNGSLDGFEIGDYPNPRDPSLRDKFDLSNSYAVLYPEKFLRPEVFYRVDDESRDLYISRRLKLGDYTLDYPWFSLGKRQYVAIDPSLLQKFEDLIDALNRAGLPGEKFKIIYGFRPPAYNLGRAEKDGNETLKAPFSLHQYGKALDIILDADNDMRMDDLDGDGKITVRDAAVLMHHVNILDRNYRDKGIPLYGGAGLYDHHDFWERPVQSPYLHFDIRGFLEEQTGYLIRWPKTWPDTGETIRWSKI